MTVEIRAMPWNHPGGMALREAQRVGVRDVYYPHLTESEPWPHPTADDIALFYVAFDGERAVGTEALRAIDDEHGEIKRMYVDPSTAAAAIVKTLENAARALGWSRLVLETGDTVLPA